MRVYIGVTLDQLAAIAAGDAVAPVADRVIAPDDSEEGEYAALMTAADVSRERTGGRRVVIVADVPSEESEVRWRQVVSLHADEDEGADRDDDLLWFALGEVGLVTGA